MTKCKYLEYRNDIPSYYHLGFHGAVGYKPDKRQVTCTECLSYAFTCQSFISDTKAMILHHSVFHPVEDLNKYEIHVISHITAKTFATTTWNQFRQTHVRDVQV